MSLGGFQALSNAWLALLLVPLVLLYFLKLKRPRQAIPSLALWRQVMQDQRVNSPFQRFKRNLLLLLQVLILLLLVLAAMQPVWRGAPTARRRVPVLIDCSASMGALDRPGGVTRLAEAQRRIGELIDGLARDQELCLISFSRTARKQCGFTNNKRLLQEALARLQVDPVPADLEEALRLVQGVARADAFDEVLLFSDGNLNPRLNVDMSFKLNYQRIPPGGPNQGITTLSAQRAVEGGWNVFAQIEASEKAEGNATIEWVQDGAVIGSERLTMAKGRAQRMVFRINSQKASVLQARLQPDGFDSLRVDNTAELDLPAARVLRVYVPAGLTTCRHALQGIPGLELVTPEAGTAPVGACDLVISDQAKDAAIPARTRLTVGLVPPDLQDLVKLGKGGTQVVDWRRDAAVLQHVELGDVVILDQPQLVTTAGEGDLENRGYQVLVYGHRGPLLLRREDAAGLALALLFNPDSSTFPYRVGFPIFVANVVQAALVQAGLAEVHGTRSLLSAAETSLAAVDRLEFNEGLSVRATAAPVKADRVLWPWLALAALGVLLFEWWYCNRKPGS